MSVQALTYGDQRVDYTIQRTPTKRTKVEIHVDPDGSVKVDAPEQASAAEIGEAVQKRARWVMRHVEEARARYAHLRPKEYISGEEVLYLGRRYVLKVMAAAGARHHTRLKGAQVQLWTGKPDPLHVKAQLKAWYHLKARSYFSRRIAAHAKSLPWVRDLPPFRLVAMNKQWGSCTKNGHLSLNPNLIKAPRPCIEYVLIHELAHLKHHDHSPEFWTLLDRFAPDRHRAKAQLDSMVELLMQE